MSKKKIELQAINAIGLGKGEKAAPGQLFKIEKEEGERLIAVGAARIPAPEQPQEATGTKGGSAPLTVAVLLKDHEDVVRELLEKVLTVENLRENRPDLVEQIETAAREGYVSKEEASADFDQIRKELEEANAALQKAQNK